MMGNVPVSKMHPEERGGRRRMHKCVLSAGRSNMDTEKGRGTQLEYKNHRASCTHWSETTDKTSPKMKNEATSELQEPAGM